MQSLLPSTFCTQPALKPGPSRPTLDKACPLRCRPNRRNAAAVKASLGSLPREPTEQCANSFHIYGKTTREKCVEAVEMYFEETWNSNNLDILDELMVDDVVYAEKNIYDEDFVGRTRLRKIIAEYQKAYPNLKFEVDKVVCDEYCQSAMAHWVAKGFCLGPRMNIPPTGKLSQFSGMTMFSFDCHGKMYEVITFRTQMAEETATFATEWE